MPRNIAIRLQAEGGAELKRELQEAGQAGQAAFQSVGAAADQAGAATDRLSQKSQQAAAAARQVQAASSSATAGSQTGFAPSPGVAREVESLRRRVDDEYRRRSQFEIDQARISRGSSAGLLDEVEVARLRALSASKYGQANDNDLRRGLTGYQKKDLLYQSGDVVASLGSGAGLGTVAFQQGPQILQGLATGEGGLKGGLSALATSASSLVTPLTVATTAATAFGAAFVYAGVQAGKEQEAMERATRGLGSASGATASMIAELAEANAKSGKLSNASAKEVTAAYVATGQIALPVIGDLTRVTSDYAKLVGTDVPSATAELARAFSDPAKGIDDLAAKIGGLDDRTRQLVQTQIEQGDKAGAQKTAADYLRATVESNTVAATGWASAWLTVSSAADTAWTSLKRVAGVTLGATPEGAEAMVKRLKEELATKRSPMDAALDPFGIEQERKRADLTAAEARAVKEKTEAERKAAVERADTLSRESNAVARGLDPNTARLSDLTKKGSTLTQALSDPTYAEKMTTEDFKRLRDGYDAVTEVKGSLVDADGRLISSAERVRQQNQLALDMAKATTDAEKADIAAKQKRLELAGQTLTQADRESQVDYARRLSLASASAKGGGDSDKVDEYDRALKQSDDRIRRQTEEAQTYGMTADVVARYRTETELLAAAKRAERDITPELTAQVQSYSEKAAAAAQQQQGLRESMRDMDDLRGTSRSTLSSFATDLSRGTSAADAMTSSLDRIKSKVLDLASTSLVDSLFGKSGTSATGLLGGLFSGGGSGGSLASGLKSLLGFDGGGYTGPGGVLEAAGIVHRGEVVWSQRDVARHGGPAVVDAWRLGHGGYTDGGIVAGMRDRFPSGSGGEPALFVRAA